MGNKFTNPGSVQPACAVHVLGKELMVYRMFSRIITVSFYATFDSVECKSGWLLVQKDEIFQDYLVVSTPTESQSESLNSSQEGGK